MNQIDERFEGLTGNITPAQLVQLLALQTALNDDDDTTGAEYALSEIQNCRHDGEPSGWPAVLQYWFDGEYREEDAPVEDWQARALEAEAKLGESRRTIDLLVGEIASLREALMRRIQSAS
tara:strand:+ start:1368 stop:1730 length:363 start_codon:yes stop_codon:yes gene_type:complete